MPTATPTASFASIAGISVNAAVLEQHDTAIINYNH
jgi:hypothetical protein